MIVKTEKIDDSTILITRERQHTEVFDQHYTVERLLQQRDAIKAQRDRDNAQRDAELVEIDELLDACKSVGIDTTGLGLQDTLTQVVELSDSSIKVD